MNCVATLLICFAPYLSSPTIFFPRQLLVDGEAMLLSVFGALVIMMSRLKVSFFRYRTEHAAEKLQLRALSTGKSTVYLDSG